MSSSLIFLFRKISRTAGSCHSWIMSFRREKRISWAWSFAVDFDLWIDDRLSDRGGGETLAFARTPFQPGPRRTESSWLLVLLVALVRML